MSAEKKLFEVKNLKKHFKVKNGILKAVDDVSFSIEKGETFGLVGESGCGKTTVGRTLIRLYTPTSGEIFMDGTDIAKFSNAQLKPYRRRMQIIFQDPYASLNPRMPVGDIIAEPLVTLGIMKKNGPERQKKIYDLLDSVGLAKSYANRYPHEFSGGQRQRIGIARALACDPEFIVCDEPISALDVSIQAQVVNLLEDLQKEKGLTYLFIAHDLSMVQHISDRVGVMYLGQIMELTTSDELYKNPLHPYTVALLSAVPIPDPDAQVKRIVLLGDVPTPINPPEGCPFCSRCSKALENCASEKPALKEVSPGHFVACHLTLEKSTED